MTDIIRKLEGLPDEETLRAMVASAIHANGGTYSIMDAAEAIRVLRPYLRPAAQADRAEVVRVMETEIPTSDGTGIASERIIDALSARGYRIVK